MSKTTSRYTTIILALAIVLSSGLGLAEALVDEQIEPHFSYRFASMEEGVEFLLNNRSYYEGFSQNDLDFRMQKKGATLEEYLDFVAGQVLEFTPEEKAAIDYHMARMEQKLIDKGYALPELDEVVFVKTTQAEEGGSSAYTHGTHIFFGEKMMFALLYDDEAVAIASEGVMWHELFHCLTRCNPDFRADMYDIIHFTVREEDYVIPPSVHEYFISNPDVGNHNSYATFMIDGKPIDCFVVLVTTKHFENAGESFFDYAETALVPVDGSDMYYTAKDASNFDEVFGTNTGYVIDPEECLADNFMLAMAYGIEGRNDEGYPNPEIIEAILDYVSAVGADSISARITDSPGGY